MSKSIYLLSFSLILCVLLMSGCKSTTSNGSWACITKINGNEYFLQNKITNNEFTVKKKIGEISKKLKINSKPRRNFTSNCLNVGVGIFSSNEDEDVLIVKQKDRELMKLTVKGFYKVH